MDRYNKMRGHIGLLSLLVFRVLLIKGDKNNNSSGPGGIEE
jgi:hypothetical protein